ncbi:MAG: glycosyl transferase [Actinomycetota bacterium]|nr:glycosyl transferase [Actinomycetota bacterium]
MPDFFQNGVIATLHDLGRRPTDELEQDLKAWSHACPMTLVLPCLVDDLDAPAMTRIVEELAAVPYLDEVVVGLDRADADGFVRACRTFERLGQHHRILWNDGPRLTAIRDEMAAHGLSAGPPGKGRNVWSCLGYSTASARGGLVALHDADVRDYHRSLPARLLHPLARPTSRFGFAKGYYHRASDGDGGPAADTPRMFGRVTRLFVTPLVRAMSTTFGPSGYLDYLDSFRYPLAGECAMTTDVAANLRIPSDWGLELGVLAEVYRHLPPSRICQVDVADGYDHKHRELSADDPDHGLHRMSGDIAKAIYRRLAIGGTILTAEGFRSLEAAYDRTALDLLDRYEADAAFNGLAYDRHAEEAALEVFARSIVRAGDEFLDDPLESAFLPSWTRVRSVLPDLPDRLVEAVDADSVS